MRIALALAVLAACSSDVSLPMRGTCNPLGTNHCMTPWPSSVFEVDDATTKTGRRLKIPQGTLPTNFDGTSVDPTAWNLYDGFSPAAPIVMSWPGGVSVSGLPPVDNMDLSIQPDTPTVLLDMTTGQLFPHYAEVDVAADGTPDSQAFFIRPAMRLTGGHRYAVAVTKQVKAKDGSDLEIPPGFAALRDGKHTDHALLEAARPRLNEALDALETAGFAKSDLVVAWDFTVASDELIHRDMVAASKRATDALAGHTIAYTITSDAPINDGSVIKRQIIGTFDAPLFLTNNGAAVSGTTVARDADGLPALQGFYKVPFTAIVPACAYTASAPVGMVMYGHGLLGDSTQTSNGSQATTSADLCLVFVGTDMRGMSTPDLPAVARVLNEASHADEVMEVLEQGLVNHIALAKAMETTFAQTLFVDAANANKVLVDPAKVYYYGLSQGGIFGASVMAYEPSIKRAALGVGAANYSMMLDRSQDWPQYRVILQGGYPDPLDDVLVLNIVQMRWDKTEPSGIANTVLVGGVADGVPAKQLLLQNALGDEQVPNVATYWEARTMGISIMGPTPTTPWGLTVQTAPLTAGASALVLEDGGAPAAPLTNTPPTDNLDMHSLTRNQPASRRQIGLFYSTGQITNQCAGACVCPTSCQ